ncbi:MAG: hypothetical protein RL571_1981 [Pseudomonadota bacterium]|jgi:hypothetical protein
MAQLQQALRHLFMVSAERSVLGKKGRRTRRFDYALRSNQLPHW